MDEKTLFEQTAAGVLDLTKLNDGSYASAATTQAYYGWCLRASIISNAKIKTTRVKKTAE